MKIRSKSSVARRIARALGRRFFQWAENNGEPRITHNGERWLLHTLLETHVAGASARAFVCFDVGANAGDYTRAVIDEARAIDCAITVHAFEPSPAAAEKFRRSLPTGLPVHTAQVALSDWTGETRLFEGKSGSSQASLVDRQTSVSLESAINVPVQRLDHYLAQHSLARVDLLKLDVEGLELAVLRGLGAQLNPGVVDVIQFEYGGTTRDARVSLRDLHDLLVGHGYAFAKLFPAALEVRNYGEWMDNFSYANYVAVSPRWLSART